MLLTVQLLIFLQSKEDRQIEDDISISRIHCLSFISNIVGLAVIIMVIGSRCVKNLLVICRKLIGYRCRLR